MSLRDRLIRHEGIRLRVYQDSVGKWTIGCGRNLEDVGISEAEALLMLDNDIATAREETAKTFPWLASMNDARWEVLVEMMFNMGPRRLRSFQHMLTALKAGDFELAAKEMLASHWASQVKGRAHELARAMRTGVDS